MELYDEQRAALWVSELKEHHLNRESREKAFFEALKYGDKEE